MKRMEFLRSRRSAVLTVAFLVLACLIVILVVQTVNKPVSARIITTTTPSVAQAPPPPKPVAVNGTYASFSYPDSMHPMAASEPVSTGGDDIAYTYLKSDIETWRLVVAFNQMSSPNLTNDGGYVMRKDNPSEYQESNVTYGNNTFIIMNDTAADGFGDVAFILNGDIEATIALTGNDASGTSSLDTTFQQVLQSWEWR